jgi:flavin-binding protein dodecin
MGVVIGPRAVTFHGVQHGRTAGFAGTVQGEEGARGGPEEGIVSVAKVSEIIASSPKSFEDAVHNGIERAHKTLKNVKGAWIAEQQVKVEGGKIKEYRVTMRVTFVLND